MLSGAQQMTVPTVVEPIGLPDIDASLLSLKIKQIVAEETGVGEVVDPLGGSYYVECLTSEYETRITKEMEAIDGLGGMFEAVRRGYVQSQLLRGMEERFGRINDGTTVRIGENKLNTRDNIAELEGRIVYKPDYDIREASLKRLGELKKNRDNGAVQRALDTLRKVAESPEGEENNLMPPIMEAVECYATVGEICTVLREVFGNYKEEWSF